MQKEMQKKVIEFLESMGANRATIRLGDRFYLCDLQPGDRLEDEATLKVQVIPFPITLSF